MQEVHTLKDKLEQALGLVKEAVDISAEMLKRGDNREVPLLWENFLKEFFTYIKLKSKAAGKNLLASIKFSRIWQ